MKAVFFNVSTKIPPILQFNNLSYTIFSDNLEGKFDLNYTEMNVRCYSQYHAVLGSLLSRPKI